MLFQYIRKRGLIESVSVMASLESQVLHMNFKTSLFNRRKEITCGRPRYRPPKRKRAGFPKMIERGYYNGSAMTRGFLDILKVPHN